MKRLGWEDTWSSAPSVYLADGAPHSLALKLLRLTRSGGIVLDLGMGMGRNATFLARNSLRVIGTDISPSAVKAVALRARALELSIECFQGDFHAIPLQESSFDAVLCTNVVYHSTITQILEVIENAHKLLIDGGYFAFNLLSERHWQYAYSRELVSHGKMTEVEIRTFVGKAGHVPYDLYLPHHFFTDAEMDALVNNMNVVEVIEDETSSPRGKAVRWSLVVRK